MSTLNQFIIYLLLSCRSSLLFEVPVVLFFILCVPLAYFDNLQYRYEILEIMDCSRMQIFKILQYEENIILMNYLFWCVSSTFGL